MKTFVFVFTLFMSSILMSGEALAMEGRDMSEPPFIMSSYDEFNDMQKEQKEAYLKELEINFKDIGALKDKMGKLVEASEWYPSWNEIRKVVYSFCEEKHAAKTCEKLIDLRVKTLNNYALKPFDLEK